MLPPVQTIHNLQDKELYLDRPRITIEDIVILSSYVHAYYKRLMHRI